MNHANPRGGELINEKILGTVKGVFLQIFEERAMETIFRLLKERFDLEIEDIPKKPEVFSQALLGLLGKGATIIEDLILERLYSDLNLDFQWKKDYTFSKYLTDLTVPPCIT